MVVTRSGAIGASAVRIESGPIRVGVLGTGVGASVHVPTLKHLPEVEVVAVWSRRYERAAAVAARHEIPLAVTDHREIVRDPEIHAVVVAAPPFLHHAMVLAALETGKHVLCEKPMARSHAEARDMVKMAAQVGVAALVNHEFRYVPVRRRIKELIASGYLGEPQAATLTVFRSTLADPHGRPFGWLMEQDKGGGMLGATGSHHVDALRWWFGEIKAVAGATATMVKKRRLPDRAALATVDADDNFAFVLRFAGGALATVHVTATAPVDTGEEIILSGSEGLLMVHGNEVLYGAQAGRALGELPIPELLEDDEPLPEDDHPLIAPTLGLMRDWIAAIRTGEFPDDDVPTFADGAKVQEVLDGVHRSSVQGRWVEVGGGRFSTART
jgi:predicted dehydrogenase